MQPGIGTPPGGCAGCLFCEWGRAFLASGVGVCELFAQGLRAQEVTTRHSQLRLFLHDGVERDDVAVEVFDSGEGYEGGCPGASAVADLTASAQTPLVLDVLTEATGRLAALHGWDTSAVDAARAHVLDRVCASLGRAAPQAIWSVLNSVREQ